MGILSFVVDKLVSNSPTSEIPTGRFTVTKFVFITGSVALILFGLEYTLHGLGSVMDPISDIIDELHDSDETESEHYELSESTEE